jgi:hypothetical protein
MGKRKECRPGSGKRHYCRCPSVSQAGGSLDHCKRHIKSIRRVIAAPDITQCGCNFTRRRQRGRAPPSSARARCPCHRLPGAALSVPATPRLGHVRDEDAFHVVRLGAQVVDEVRRRVQQDTRRPPRLQRRPALQDPRAVRHGSSTSLTPAGQDHRLPAGQRTDRGGENGLAVLPAAPLHLPCRSRRGRQIAE